MQEVALIKAHSDARVAFRHHKVAVRNEALKRHLEACGGGWPAGAEQV